MFCGPLIQPKKQFKVQIIGIFEEIDSFIDQKCKFKEMYQKIWAGPSPLIWTKSKRRATFFVKPSLSE